MTVYVDEIVDYGDLVKGYARRYGTLWCHMTADTRPELMTMARRLGIPSKWVQHDDDDAMRHFDLIPRKRAQAVLLGAREITDHEAGEMLMAIREQQRAQRA